MEEDIMNNTGRQMRGGVSDVRDPYGPAVTPSAARDKEIRDRADKLLLNEEAKEYNARLVGDENVFTRIIWEDVEQMVKIPLDQEGVFLTSKIHWISGRAGAGKTILAYWKLVQLAKRKRYSAIYECEMGEQLAKGLLINLGATSQDLRYIQYYKAQLDGTVVNLQRHGRAFCNMLIDQGIMTILYDALNPLLVAATLNENIASEVRQFVNAACYPMSEAGGMVMVLDHMGQVATDRARGSSDKAAAGHVDLTLSKSSTFARGVSGAIELTCNKDRTGSIADGSTLYIEVISRPDGSIRLKPGEWEWQLSDIVPEVIRARGRRGNTQQKIIEFGRQQTNGFTIAEAAAALDMSTDSVKAAVRRGTHIDSDGKIAFRFIGRGIYEVVIDAA
jgi:hypothetical protein